MANASAKAAKEAVERAEYDGGFNDDHGVATQRAHAHDVDRQGGFEVFEVVTKPDDLGARGVHARAGAQHFEHAQAKQPDEALVDHVQRGDIDAEAAVLSGQIVFAHLHVQVVPAGGAGAVVTKTGRQGGQLFRGQKGLGIGHDQGVQRDLLHHKAGEINLFDAAKVFEFFQHGVEFEADLFGQGFAKVGLTQLVFGGLAHDVERG